MRTKNDEKFQGKGLKHFQRQNHQKYKAINDIVYPWFKKWGSSGIFVNGSLIKEEEINIKEGLNRGALNDFKASDGWLEKWEFGYGIHEKQICGESFYVSDTTVDEKFARGLHKTRSKRHI